MRIRLIGYLFFSLTLVACSRTEDLSHLKPFDKAIGKSFVFQKDCFVIYAPLVQGNNEKQKVIKDEYEIRCGSLSPSMKIVGNIKNGQIIKIIKIDGDTTLETTYAPNFQVKLMNITSEQASPGNVDNIYSDMSTGSLINSSMSNSENWGDPPIFSSEYLKPIESDGVWWK